MTSEINLSAHQTSVLQTTSLTLTCDHPISHLGPTLLLFAGNERMMVSGICDLRTLNDASIDDNPAQALKQISKLSLMNHSPNKKRGLVSIIANESIR